MKGVAILVGLWRDRWSADASTVFDEQKTSADFVSGRNSAIACFFVVVIVFRVALLCCQCVGGGSEWNMEHNSRGQRLRGEDRVTQVDDKLSTYCS